MKTNLVLLFAVIFVFHSTTEGAQIWLLSWIYLSASCNSGYYSKNGVCTGIFCFAKEIEKILIAACPAGQFQPASGQTTCNGSCVFSFNILFQLACPAGTYQSQTGQSSCISQSAVLLVVEQFQLVLPTNIRRWPDSHLAMVVCLDLFLPFFQPAPRAMLGILHPLLAHRRQIPCARVRFSSIHQLHNI